VIDGIDKLREAERMAAYGLMVAGVAHEVRNPLFALGSAAYVLGQELKDRGDLRAQIALIERESRRLAALMDELLEFARPPALLLAPAEVADVLAEAVIVFKTERAGAAPAIDVRVEAREGLPPVVLDRSRVVQVLVNLTENALKHARGARTITLGAAAVSRADPSGASDWVAIEVKDDGEGIGRQHLPRLFEPFYTTGKGTGLGLAIVRRIVSDHEGTIEVASEPGQGTRFAIFLPVRGPLRRPSG
jgi:signal transduction histidine kinase